MTKVNWLIVSDVHLGHQRTETEHIITNLDKFIYECPYPFEMIAIPGDLFDRSLELSSTSTNTILSWFVRLLNFCKKNSIGIRLLEGTPSHDRKQGKVLSQLFDNDTFRSCDFKYIETMLIEHHQKTGLSILYIPDEYDPSTDKIYDMAIDLLKENHLKKVDLVFMHGQFQWQLPPHINAPKHVEQNYIDITNLAIICGHVHTHSVYENKIIIPGSFDRLKQGEEEPKGGIYLSILDKQFNWLFIPNENARIYNSYTLTKKDSEKTLFKYLDQYKDKANIRFIITNEHKLFNQTSELLGELRRKYSHLTIKILKESNKINIKKPETLVTVKHIDNITPDNIKVLLENKMGKPLTDLQINILEDL